MVKRALGLAAVTAIAMFAAPIASSAQSYPSNQYGQTSNAGDYVTGRIVASQPYNLWLGGAHVTMHDGTIINPTGVALQPGMRVRVMGYWNDNGTFEANQIDVVPPPASAYSSPMPYGNVQSSYVTNAYAPIGYSPYSSRPDYLTGSVADFQPYNVWLGRGSNSLHITLHDGTVINPTGITLSPGMRVRIWGHWNNDGTFEADQVDVVNAGDFQY